MAHWIIVDAEGVHHQTSTEGEKKPRVPKGHRLIRVPRPSHDPHCEHWDEKKGAWVFDADKRRRLDAEIAVLMMPREEIARRLVALEERVTQLEQEKQR